MIHSIGVIRLTLFLSFICGIFASKSHPVTTLLNAKWPSTPVTLEIAEYLADESPNLFWDFAHELNELNVPLHELETDLQVYKAVISVAEKLIGPSQLALLKLSLSMHSLSPRVQAHFQIAREVLRFGDCQTDFFVTIGHRIACNIDEVKKGIEIALKEANKAKTKNNDDNDDDEEEEIYSSDHIYPGSENNTITTIFCGQIGTKDFKTIHKLLKAQAETGKTKYIVRHFLRVKSEMEFDDDDKRKIQFHLLLTESGHESSSLIRLWC